MHASLFLLLWDDGKRGGIGDMIRMGHSKNGCVLMNWYLFIYFTWKEREPNLNSPSFVYFRGKVRRMES